MDTNAPPPANAPTKRPSWKRRLGIGAVSLVTLAVSFTGCFLLFVMGAFASDSGTQTALTISFSLIGFAGFYALATVLCAVFSQIQNSYKLAVLPIVLPALFIAWIFLV